MSKKPDRTPEEKAELFLADWQEKYSIAIDNARAAAETTGTNAWQLNYQNVLSAHRNIETACCDSIAEEVKAIRQSGSNETFEKAIKDSLKTIVEERERFAAWRSRAVAPYQTAALNCAELLATVGRAAADAERTAPLVDNGLREAVMKIVSTWPVAKWDEERGIVAVVGKPKSQAEAA